MLTIAQVAERLGVSVKTVRRRIDAGEIPVIRDGRVVRVEEAAVAAYLRGHRVGLEPPPAEEITAGQVRAFHAKAADLDRWLRRERGESKLEMVGHASFLFGREISSVNDLTMREASQLLDEMETRLYELSTGVHA